MEDAATRDRESRLNSEEANARLRKARDAVEEVAKAEARVRAEEEKLASVKAETERAAALLEKHRDEYRVDAAKMRRRARRAGQARAKASRGARSHRVAPGKSVD